ncbi:MAG: phosphatidate cytidylyltransferase [Anaerolineae bacterium]|nr:phosphatidate cytidylyltransferase [Anaerolineae bacterium]
MLKARIISAAVLIPLSLLVIFLGGWLYWLLIVVLSLLACAEFVELTKLKAYTLSLPGVFALCITWQAGVLWEQGSWFVPTFSLVVAAITFRELILRHNNPQRIDPTAQWATTLAVGLYIGIGSSFLIRLRELENGMWWTLTALPIIWVSESGAFFVGKRFGKHKMSPTISPGKSWEGYAAQVTSGMLTGALAGWLLPVIYGSVPHLNPWTGGGLGLLLSALSTSGDFFVSMIKREVGVKDTGSLIPGHGGALDRIDSLLWAGGLAWAYIRLISFI